MRRGGRDKTRNVADADALKEQSTTLKQQQERAESDLRHLVAQPEFQRYIWALLGRLKMWADHIPLNSELYIQAAEQRVARRIWKELEAVNPEALLQMMRRNLNEGL